MDQLPRALIVAAIILGGAVIVRGLYPADRFTMIAAQGGGAYRLDRLTGSVFYCDPLVCRLLPVATLVPAQPKAASPANTAGAATGT